MSEPQTNFYQAIREQQTALAAIGCDPTWALFENTFGWFQIRKRLSPKEHDRYHETWLEVYRKKRNPQRKTCR